MTRFSRTSLALAALAGLSLPAFANDGAAGQTGTLSPELSPPVLLEADGKPIDTEVGHAAPFYGDFDGDKVPDLLVGQFGGGKLKVYRNEGTAAAPVFKNMTWFKAGADLGVVPAG